MLPALDEREIGLQLLPHNLVPFLNTGITCADFNKLRKISFLKELLMIAERGIEISFLIFFRIDVSMLLLPVLLFEMRVFIKSDISSGVVGVMKNDSAFRFLKLSQKFLFVGNMNFWSSLLIDEKTIRFPCTDF